MAERHSVAVLQQLGTLFNAGTAAGLDDGQLLERFVARRDETAFAALVARHGPLVLGACRRLLANPADIEDAFQATFLVLVQRAYSLKDPRLLSTWLYKVAYRVALRARTEADRRRRLTPGGMAVARVDDLERRELRAVIDEEIFRLPRLYRLPVVLCYLEGLTHEEAAQRLGCPLGTVNSRLASARQRLRVRLGRRGLAYSGMLVGTASMSAISAAAVPTALMQVTISTALRVAVAGSAPAPGAHLAEGLLRVMTMSKLKFVAAGALAAGLAVAGLGVVPRGAPGAPTSAAAAEHPPSAALKVSDSEIAPHNGEPEAAVEAEFQPNYFNFGSVRVGATVEGSVRTFRETENAGGLAIGSDPLPSCGLTTSKSAPRNMGPMSGASVIYRCPSIPSERVITPVIFVWRSVVSEWPSP